MPRLHVQPHQVLRRRNVPADEREEADVDVSDLRQARRVPQPHHRRVGGDGGRGGAAVGGAGGEGKANATATWSAFENVRSVFFTSGIDRGAFFTGRDPPAFL